MLCNACGELYFFKKGVSLRRKLAQRVLEIDITEAGSAKIKAFDGSAAAVTGGDGGFAIMAGDGGYRLAVFAQALPGPPPCAATIGQTVL